MKKQRQFKDIQRNIARILAPPENLTVSQWADKYRILSREASSLYGKWKTKLTPYLKRPMDVFTDPKVKKIVIEACSQVGKTEVALNILAFIIHQMPCSCYYMMPTEADAKDFSNRRIAPMIRDMKVLTPLFKEARSAGNTILEKKFYGGLLRLLGTNAASPLSSSPVPIVFMDEVDRFTKNIPGEGDPIALVDARQSTFFNRKTIMVSTPTVKGASRIHKEFMAGTQEHWKHKCPNCGQWHELLFDDLVFEHEKKVINGEVVRKLTSEVLWECPSCGFTFSKEEMEKTPTKWIADNPDGEFPSFSIKGLDSPFRSWKDLVLDFFSCLGSPAMMQTFKNTKLGELWENRGDVAVDETGLLSRREDYGTNDDGTPVEIPDAVGFLTAAVDTQDDRYEYEILGHGIAHETYGIKKGIIMGYPNDPEVLQKLADVILGTYYFKNKEYGIKPALVFIDSGGHYKSTVYSFCKEMWQNRQYVFPIKGKGGEGYPFTPNPKLQDEKVYLYTIGTDAGKAQIMHDIEIEEPGPYFCHFPVAPEAGYNKDYFKGLLSERLEMVENKQSGRLTPRWKVIEGHQRNEPLDLRNYNLAAAHWVLEMGINPETEIEKRKNPAKFAPKKKKKRPRPQNYEDFVSDW